MDPQATHNTLLELLMRERLTQQEQNLSDDIMHLFMGTRRPQMQTRPAPLPPGFRIDDPEEFF
jgi:hypothetical protein